MIHELTHALQLSPIDESKNGIDRVAVPEIYKMDNSSKDIKEFVRHNKEHLAKAHLENFGVRYQNRLLERNANEEAFKFFVNALKQVKGFSEYGLKKAIDVSHKFLIRGYTDDQFKWIVDNIQ